MIGLARILISVARCIPKMNSDFSHPLAYIHHNLNKAELSPASRSSELESTSWQWGGSRVHVGGVWGQNRSLFPLLTILISGPLIDRALMGCPRSWARCICCCALSSRFPAIAAGMVSMGCGGTCTFGLFDKVVKVVAHLFSFNGTSSPPWDVLAGALRDLGERGLRGVFVKVFAFPAVDEEQEEDTQVYFEVLGAPRERLGLRDTFLLELETRLTVAVPGEDPEVTGLGVLFTFTISWFFTQANWDFLLHGEATSVWVESSLSWSFVGLKEAWDWRLEADEAIVQSLLAVGITTVLLDKAAVERCGLTWTGAKGLTGAGIEGLFTAEDDFKVGFIFISGSDVEAESVSSLVNEQPWSFFPAEGISTVLFSLASLFLSFEVSFWKLSEDVVDLSVVCSAFNFLNKTLLFPKGPALFPVAEAAPDLVMWLWGWFRWSTAGWDTWLPTVLLVLLLSE